MRMKMIAASVLAIAMASSAYAQSNPAPAGSTMDKNQTDTGGGANADATKPMAKDMKKPMAKNTSTKAKGAMDKEKCKDPASSAGTGKLQTQGGKSNATPEDEACAAHNN
ncbi:hypothetical protein QTL95_17705 [Rhizobium sp. S152]|uniref:hypothetical protein n=1 Tax=Rhizobium sp. S152 TaxID=3055038 RepID=UPI0025AA2C5F|nr:hypothetical protein [Rhizobium sp. S152]MDM9627734.1 hypothetical protein [Rhizobium sp. S152]